MMGLCMPPSNKRQTTKPATVNKTEIVTLRLDPKTRFGLELLSRKQYRTLSSVVEWAINNALLDEDQGVPQLDHIWDVEDADRLVKLALYHPNLLNYEEQVIWKLICENGYFWKGRFEKKEWVWTCAISTAVFDRIRSYYETIKEVALGTKEASLMPTWNKKDPTAISLDDEIPF